MSDDRDDDAEMPDSWDLPDVADLGDVELSQILRHLNRATAAGRRKASADPATRSYLQAGLRLLTKAVSERSGDEQEDPAAHPFLAWLSRQKIVEEVMLEPSSTLPSRGSVGGLRDHWDPHSDYVSDLLLVAMTAENWAVAVSRGARGQLQQMASNSLVDSAHDVAYTDLDALRRSTGFRVQVLATAMAKNEPSLAEALAEMYKVITDSWMQVYELLLESRELMLRPGFTVKMLTDILAGMAEGLALRLTATSDTDIIDDRAHRSLLGTGALAVLASATTQKDGGDARSFDEYLHDAFN